MALLSAGPLGPGWAPGIRSAHAAAAPADEPEAPPSPSNGGSHVVQAGDTVYSIARRNGITVDALVAANNLADANVIREGQKLVIPPAGPAAAGPEASPAILMAAQAQAPEPIPTSGPAEEPPRGGPVQAAPVVKPARAPAATPAPRAAASGTPTVKVTTTHVSTLAWPIALKPPSIAITQPYRPGHRAIDIGAPTGTPIKAAARGAVILADKGDDAYGWKIVLDHGEGIHTWYAHLGELAVAVGDRVEVGQKIGLVGSTGVSTGPHLHFELRVNGNLIDPRMALP